jgi:hypothetical protein
MAVLDPATARMPGWQWRRRRRRRHAMTWQNSRSNFRQSQHTWMMRMRILLAKKPQKGPRISKECKLYRMHVLQGCNSGPRQQPHLRCSLHRCPQHPHQRQQGQGLVPRSSTKRLHMPRDRQPHQGHQHAALPPHTVAQRPMGRLPLHLMQPPPARPVLLAPPWRPVRPASGAVHGAAQPPKMDNHRAKGPTPSTPGGNQAQPHHPHQPRQHHRLSQSVAGRKDTTAAMQGLDGSARPLMLMRLMRVVWRVLVVALVLRPALRPEAQPGTAAAASVHARTHHRPRPAHPYHGSRCGQRHSPLTGTWHVLGRGTRSSSLQPPAQPGICCRC